MFSSSSSGNTSLNVKPSVFVRPCDYCLPEQSPGWLTVLFFVFLLHLVPARPMLEYYRTRNCPLVVREQPFMSVRGYKCEVPSMFVMFLCFHCSSSMI